MKNKKLIIVLCSMLVVILMVVGLVWALSLDNEDDKKDKDSNKDTQVVTKGVMGGIYNKANFVCEKQERDNEAYTLYDTIYVFLDGETVKKTNLIKVFKCKSKDVFDDQKKNDDNVFKRYYDQESLVISYEYADEQLYIGPKGEKFIDKTGEALKTELQGKGYSCK
jgi:hypothetical protein